MKTGRNDPCPCGSGKKYKACCLARKQASDTIGQKLLMWVVLAILGIGLVVGIYAAVYVLVFQRRHELTTVATEQQGVG